MLLVVGGSMGLGVENLECQDQGPTWPMSSVSTYICQGFVLWPSPISSPFPPGNFKLHGDRETGLLIALSLPQMHLWVGNDQQNRKTDAWQFPSQKA